MIVPLGTDQIRLITFTEPQIERLHRFGGRAPLALEPVDQDSRYLLTIGLEDSLCLSVFLKDDAVYFIETVDTVFTARDSCVEVFFHKAMPRREDDRFHSTFSGHGLSLSPLQKDEIILDNEINTPHHRNKLGGGTYLIHEENRSLVNDLERQGYNQFLQLDGSLIGSPGVEVSGDDAFGLGIFHFYLRPSDSYFDWCCFVESD